MNRNAVMKAGTPKSLHAAHWSCRCGARGVLVIANENGAVYFQRLIDVHRLSSPYCKEKEIGIGDWTK
jgi:hypothetical protein